MATQRELASMLEVSLGTVNTLIKECMASSYLVTSPEGNYQLTEAGMTFLEPFRVDAAPDYCGWIRFPICSPYLPNPRKACWRYLENG